MDVIEAMLERRSIRSFTSNPVPKGTVLKVLEAATRAPSSSNTQSWEIFVAGGKVLENIRQAYVDRLEKKIAGKSEVAGTSRDKLPSGMLERINHQRMERAKAEGIDPAVANSLNSERGARLFGAPIILVLCMNRVMSLFSTYDLGLLTENILLAAQNFGLGSIIASAIVTHPDVLRKELGIPDDLLIVEGIALGYADKEARVNTFRSPRRPIQEVVTFKGL
ncbi:MAG: nitroreductase [Chloroflexi bacterium]|nr:nitroreductase [Chloroflexota bacterium]